MKKSPAVPPNKRPPSSAVPPPKGAKSMAALFALTIFAGAFLLFQVQPLIAKFILPWFGGSSAVWTTCMLFFQVFLVAGYAYAHLTTRYLSARAQAILHTALLLAALAALPIVPGTQWKPGSADAPAWRILELLTVCLGLPYFVLSATGPLLQAWFVKIKPGALPYRLYALSNAGSLLALISYPFVVEPSLTRRMQANVWASGFGAFVLLCGGCAWFLWKNRTESASAGDVLPRKNPKADHPPARVPTAADKALWFFLPMCGSVLLLATTNKLCLDVASFPFLWVLPLSVYLLTFIFCFDRPAWYARKTFTLLLVPEFGFALYALYRGSNVPLVPQAVIYCANLFVSCMVCHGEVYRLKPPARSLTSFYLLLAAGGAAGGAFVALVAPLVFRSYAEMNWSLWLLAALVLFIHARDRTTWKFGKRRLQLWPGALGGVLALGVGLLLLDHLTKLTIVARSRNFYSVLRVEELRPNDPEFRSYLLVNGSIHHGLQFLNPARAAIPTTYYNPPSGVGLAMDYFASRTNRNVGVVGLGAGTLAAYGRPGDTFRFYELNPEVLQMANTWFSFLKQSPAHIEVILGDARLSLERESPQQFDLLVLDAFSSDAIPVHLLTREAFDTYARHLKPDGVIAVHVSNRNLDLIPVVAGGMEYLNMDMIFIQWVTEPMPFGFHSSSWLLLTHNRDFLNSKMIVSRAERPDSPLDETAILWTDDYASLFPIIRK